MESECVRDLVQQEDGQEDCQARAVGGEKEEQQYCQAGAGGEEEERKV